METGDYCPRRRNGPKNASGQPVYEEDALVCRGNSPWNERNLLHCSIYAESTWRRGHCARMVLRGWSIGFLHDGDATLICDGCHHDLKGGDAYLLPEGSQVELRPGKSGTVRKRHVLLEGSLTHAICARGSLADTHVIRLGNSRRLGKIYDTIRDTIMCGCPHTREAVSTHCYSLLAELSRQVEPSRYPPPLIAALELIDADPRADVSLDALSQACGVSARTLARLFRTHIGVSPIEHAICRRMEHAKTLLQVASMPIKEVAWRCGFNSESFFSRTFRKRVGVSPRSFRSKGAL